LKNERIILGEKCSESEHMNGEAKNGLNRENPRGSMIGALEKNQVHTVNLEKVWAPDVALSPAF